MKIYSTAHPGNQNVVRNIILSLFVIGITNTPVRSWVGSNRFSLNEAKRITKNAGIEANLTYNQKRKSEANHPRIVL
jgi:hypothetical protein